MGKKTDSGTETLHILVIADRQRLRSLFDFCESLPLIRLSTASTIDEGIKIAAGKAPALLFVQGRTGGLSGEIIARHIRQELKESRTRLVLFCDEEDVQTPGNRSFFTSIDTSVPDDELAAEVESLVASLLPGAKKEPARRKKMTARKAASEIPLQPSEPDPASGGPDQEVADIVEIRTDRSCNEEQQDKVSSSMAERSPAHSFRDRLDIAMDISASTITGESPAEPNRDISSHRHEFHGTLEEQSRERFVPGIPGSAKVRVKRRIVLSVALLTGIAALFLFYAAQSTPEKSGETAQPAADRGPAGAKQEIPAASPIETGIQDADNRETNTGPVSVEDRKPGEKPSMPSDAGYLKYTVRRGDTLVTILTSRFGLSERMAESLIPEILEKNGITRRTVLSIGQNILIPTAVKIQPAPES